MGVFVLQRTKARGDRKCHSEFIRVNKEYWTTQEWGNLIINKY